MRSSEYESSAVEAEVRSFWEARDIYRYDSDLAGSVFAVDTPPPYVSASHLHVGHAMSYSQADFVVRYHRMRGEHVFYPMGFDDNGLSTERFVEQKYGIKAADTPRAEFIRLCLEETKATAARYEGSLAQVRSLRRLSPHVLDDRPAMPGHGPDQLYQAARGRLYPTKSGPDSLVHRMSYSVDTSRR